MNCLFSLSLSLVFRENRRGQGKRERGKLNFEFAREFKLFFCDRFIDAILQCFLII
jgi:hypothetical protein